jgi:hypothetical protein
LLRHTRPDTTLLNYVKEIPDSVFGMVDATYEGISRTDETQRLAESPTLEVCTETLPSIEHILNTISENWCARRDSNSRPTAPEAAALSS